jgi:hypothetical protein
MNALFRMLLVVALVAGTASIAGAAAIHFEALGTGPNGSQPYGAIYSLKVGTTAFTDDTAVQAPPKITAPGSAAGLLSSLRWAGGIGDPIVVKFALSRANDEKLKLLQHTLPKGDVPMVSAHVIVFWFDQEVKLWYTAFDCAISGKAITLDVPPVPGAPVTLSAPASGVCKFGVSAGQTILKQG